MPENMESSTLLLLLGSFLLLVGLIGGGITAQQISLPKLAPLTRVISVVLGLLLILPSVYGQFAPMIDEPEPPAAPVKIETFDTGKTRYRVCNVPEDDPDKGLRVRVKPGMRGPGGGHATLAIIPRDADDIMYLGQRALVGASVWYQVSYVGPGVDSDERISVSGWASSSYLC